MWWTANSCLHALSDARAAVILSVGNSHYERWGNFKSSTAFIRTVALLKVAPPYVLQLTDWWITSHYRADRDTGIKLFNFHHQRSCVLVWRFIYSYVVCVGSHLHDCAGIDSLLRLCGRSSLVSSGLCYSVSAEHETAYCYSQATPSHRSWRKILYARAWVQVRIVLVYYHRGRAHYHVDSCRFRVIVHVVVLVHYEMLSLLGHWP